MGGGQSEQQPREHIIKELAPGLTIPLRTTAVMVDSHCGFEVFQHKLKSAKNFRVSVLYVNMEQG